MLCLCDSTYLKLPRGIKYITHARKHFWTVHDHVRLNKRTIFGLFCLLDLLTSRPAQEKVQNLCFDCEWHLSETLKTSQLLFFSRARAVSFKSPSRIRLNIHRVTVTPHFLPVLITLRRRGQLFEKVEVSEIKSGGHTRGKGVWETCCHGKGKYSQWEVFLQHVVGGYNRFKISCHL